MTLRYYANAQATTLEASCSVTATAITVTSTSGLPISYPYICIIDRGAATEEVVLVTAAVGNDLTVTRGYDSTTAFAHAEGASFVLGFSAIDLREANAHVNANSNVHGVTGSVVGTTDVQTVTNKTLGTTNTVLVQTGDRVVISDATGKVVSSTKTIPVGDLVGTTDVQTLTQKTLALGSNTVSGTKAQFDTALTDGDFATLANTETLTNKTIALGSNTVSGTKAQFDAALSDGDFATLAGTESLSNKTLTSSSLNGFNPSDGWTAYTVTLTAATTNPADATTTRTGYFRKIGNVVEFYVRIVFTTDANVGAGRYAINLPEAPTLTNWSWYGTFEDNSAADLFPIVGRHTGTGTNVELYRFPATAGATLQPFNSSLPAPPAVGDVFVINGSYRTA